MPFVNVTLLRQQQMPEALIEQYVRAVDEAWAEVAPHIQGLASRPAMSLQLQDPTRDRETVTVTVGISAQYGATSARDPAGLRKALVQHLRERFVPNGESET